MEITFERKEAYSEVCEILNCMEQKYVEKIPNKLKRFFKENALPNYKFNVDMNRPLSEQNLKRKTLVILAMLNINYWCEDEKHKEELLYKYNENERIHQKELSEKYNIDNLFKKQNETKDERRSEQTDIVSMTEYKEPLIKRIINKIKDFFGK